MDKIDITDDQNDELCDLLREGVTNEDSDEVEAFLDDLDVPGSTVKDICRSVSQVGAKSSEVGGSFCFGCPYDLTEAIDELRTSLQSALTVDGEQFNL